MGRKRKDPSEALAIKPNAEGSAKRSGKGGASDGKKPRRPRTETPAKPGMPGSVDDTRRCTATANRTGERCKAPAIKGHNVCRVHGGASPQVVRTAKQRLLELASPAVAALQEVLTNPETDNATKVRAALGILDRTGHGPGAKLEVGISKWDDLMEAASAEQIDRGALALDSSDQPALPSGRGGGHEPTWEDVAQAQSDARAEAWREYDSEDAADYERRPNFRHSQTVRGEATVVEDSILPGIPPTSGPSEYGGDPLAWPYDRPPAS